LRQFIPLVAWSKGAIAVAGRIDQFVFVEAKRLLAAAAGSRDRAAFSDSDPVAVAQRLYKLRRRRDETLPAGLFSDPAWDILLDLYVHYGTDRLISVGSACIASAVPPTTGLRYIKIMEVEGLIERFSDDEDGRRFYVSLTRSAYQTMTAILLNQTEPNLDAIPERR
jgi:DNA-binding MarR family transcriptional regulator